MIMKMKEKIKGYLSGLRLKAVTAWGIVKEKVLDFLYWLARNWYPVLLTIVCFLTAVEVFPTWVSWAALMGSFGVWAFNRVRR